MLLLISLSQISSAQYPEIAKILEQTNSRDRIKALCIFFDDQLHAKNPQKFDAVIKACYAFEKKTPDQQFKAYLDFYSREKAITYIMDDELYIRKGKMLKIWTATKQHYEAQGDEYFTNISNAYISHIYFMRKEYEKSLQSWLITEAGFKKIGYNKYPDIGKHLHNMALVFYFFRDYKKAAELMETSVKLPAYAKNYHIQSFNTLGAAYYHLEHFKRAERAYIKTIETAEFYKENAWIALGSRGLADVWLKEGKYEKSRDILTKSLPILELVKQQYPREYSEHLLGLIKTNIQLNQLAKAKQYIKALNYTKSSTDKDSLKLFGVTYQDINYWQKYYEIQYQFHDALNQYKEAYRYADSLYAIKYKIDSNFNKLEVQVAQNKIEVQNKQFLSDKKEVIIQNKNQQLILIGCLFAVIAGGSVILIRKNQRIRKQHQTIQLHIAELQTILNQKQVLLSELQHRVKNNLQHVINILEIQKESIDFNSIDELIRSTQNRIYSMALLHKKLHVTEHAADINLNRYAQELSKLVINSYTELKQEIQIHIDCDVEHLSLEKALPLGLIMVELISNSLKHAFKQQDKGEIILSLKAEKNNMRMIYEDNGVGFDFIQSQSKGLGQDIIKGLIEQLKGQIETKPEKGFRLLIYFKNALKK